MTKQEKLRVVIVETVRYEREAEIDTVRTCSSGRLD